MCPNFCIYTPFLLFNTRSTFDNTMLFQIGASIRLDTTLVDFTEMRWERGDITFLYRGDAASPEESLYVLDNQLRVYQKVNIFLNVITYSDHLKPICRTKIDNNSLFNLCKVRYEESEIEFEDEVDLLMSSDIVSAQISTKPITFTTVQSGWFFKEDRKFHFIL